MQYRFPRFLALLTVAMLAFSAVSCEKDDTDEEGGGSAGKSEFTQSSPWTLIGTLSGSSWDKDFEMKSNGDWHAAFDVVVTATDEFKFRKNRGWDTNFGASSVKVGEKISLVPGGDNIKLPAGTYDMYISELTQSGYILKAGSKFTHANEGQVEEGGVLGGDYDANLASAAKKSSLTYQINVYSFADSDGDGWGDFQGIIDHLDYIDALGATGLWLSPIQKSQSYHAYDITDYYTINPKYGGKNATAAQAEAKFQELVTKAKEKNIAIYLDYVLNHSGDQNEWFKKAKAGDSKYRNYYVFSDNPTEDTKNKKIDNFAGQTDYHMGGWHSVVSGNAGYKGLLHFELDVTSASAPKLTITQATGGAQSSNTDTSVSWFIFDNSAQRMYKKSDKVYEITLNVNNDWGVLVKDHATEWGDHKWGAKSGDQTVKFGTAKTLVKGDAANDLIFSGDVTWYFGSFDGSMPDLNYGPYTSCANSDTFKDLAASADKWIKMGIGGLRLDAVMWIYQCHTDANVAFLSAWYDHCNATYKANGGQGDFFMVGEAYDYNASTVGGYYKGLPSCFDFAYYGTIVDRINNGKGSDFGSTVNGFITQYQNGYNSRKYTHSSGMIESPKLSNHDEDRVASKLGNHPQKKRLAGAVLLTSPGKPFVYQGEELGYWGVKQSGDENVRQPIYWTKGGTVPTSWCNFNKEILKEGMSVEEQAADNGSLLELYRHFAYARNTHPALAEGKLETRSSGNNAVATWYMTASSEKVLVAHNFSGASATISLGGDKVGKLIVSNGEVSLSGSELTLPAYSSVVYQLN